MSQTNLADPDVVAKSDQEVIDVPDDSASQSAGNKRAPGRPAIAEAVIQEAQRTDAIDDCDVRSAPSVELCSTTEMLEVFSEFYDGDNQDMHGQNVDNTRIDSSVPFSAKEFDLDFTGSAEQVELPNMDFGVSTDAYDLNELLE
ncbi:TPA: hypothetical protein ACH3X3_006004 [Trebouxia sp. C0006]